MNGKMFLVAALLGSAASSFALPITPISDSFGPQSFTFGGSGIPSDPVAVTNLSGGTVLGLTASPRCTMMGALCGATPTNDGAGTFTAQAGSPFGDSTSSWNFNWYIASGTLAGKAFRLFYDFDPAAANDQSTHGIINFGNLGGTSNVNQNSQNLGFGFLAVTNPIFGITAPSFTPFNKDALGTYTFALVAYDSTGIALVELGRAAIAVSVVPEPEAYGLAIAGMAVIGFFGMRRKAAKPA